MKSVDRVVAEIARVLRGIEAYLPKAGALEKLLLPCEVADLLRVEIETLEVWRRKGVGPAYIKLGRDVRYRPSDVLLYVEGRLCLSTWESGALRNMTPP